MFKTALAFSFEMNIPVIPLFALHPLLLLAVVVVVVVVVVRSEASHICI